MRRVKRLCRVFSVLLVLVVTLYLAFGYVRDLDWFIETFTGEPRVELFDFQETAMERSCFINHESSKVPIPKVVHVIWLNNPELTFMNYLTMRSALDSIQPDRLNLHYTSINEDNIWFRKLRPSLTLVHHNLGDEYPLQTKQRWQLSHLADIIRLDILQREGGIYLDMDVISLQSFDALLDAEKDVILGNEGGDRHGLCNAVILARPNSSFLTRWISSYDTFSAFEWNYHSVVLPKQLSLQHQDEICELSPTVLFWPTWTRRHVRYMHKIIDENEVQHLQNTIAETKGGMYTNQLAYHAWSQLAGQYLRQLSPEKVKTENTRFNVLVRRFLD